MIPARLAIAYEPIWAIGTGLVPTIANVAAMHGAIRGAWPSAALRLADGTRLLYGGSVNGDNAAELLGAGDVDGALVGGASLTAAKFGPIVAAAAGGGSLADKYSVLPRRSGGSCRPPDDT